MPEEPDGQQAEQETTETEQEQGAPEAVGDHGEESTGESTPEQVRKLQEKNRKANSEAANLRKRLKEVEPLAQKARELEDAQKSTEEKLTSQLQQEQQRSTQLVQRAVKAEVRGLAAEKFADPDDAAAFLDLGGYVSEEGEVDTDQIKSDLADLLKKKPHLAKAESRRPAPDRSQGSSGNGKTKSDPANEFAAFMGQKLAGR